MDYTQLNELVAIEKKSNASKEKKTIYRDELIALLNEESFSDNAQKYIKSGFAFCAAEPLAKYISSQKDERECLKRLFATDMYKKNENKIAHRLVLSLLECACNGIFQDRTIMLDLINQIPITGRDKKKTFSNEIPQFFERLFASKLTEKSMLPTDLQLDKYAKMNFSSYIMCVVPPLKKSGKISSHTINMIYGWINELLGISEAEDNSGDNLPQNDSSKESANQPVHQETSINAEEIEPADIKEYKDNLRKIASALDFMSAKLSSYESANRRLEKKNKELLGIKEDLYKSLDEKNATIEGYRETVKSKDEEIKNKEAFIFEYQREIRIKTEEINRLKSDLEKQNAVLSVYSADKENSESEILNGIASKLKSQYKDFNSARGEEMSDALGENFRYQIEEIFKILKKSGIDVEGR